MSKLYMAEEAELKRQWLVRDTHERVARKDMGLLLPYAAQVVATLDECLVARGVPPELRDMVEVHHLDRLPNRGMCPVKVLGPILAPFRTAYLFGSGAVQRVYPGKWLPSDWDVFMDFEDAETALGELLEGLGGGSWKYPDEKVCDLHAGPFNIKLHRTCDIKTHLRAVAESEIGIFYRFFTAEWEIMTRALAHGPVPPSWILNPRESTFLVRDKDLDKRAFASTWTFCRALTASWELRPTVERHAELVSAQVKKYASRAEDAGVALTKDDTLDDTLAEIMVYPCSPKENFWAFFRDDYF
jgi:hypothetical protein